MNLLNEYKPNYPVPKRKLQKVKFGCVDSSRGQETMNPPIELDDYYYWMRDDSRKSEEVLNHLKLENTFTEEYMQDTTELQKDLYNELLSHIQETYDSLPLPNDNNGWDSEYYYFIRTVEGKSYPIHCRINMKSKVITELLDENKIAEGKTSCDISNVNVTKDHQYISYGIDTTGNEKYELKIYHIETNEEFKHILPELTYCDYMWFDEYIYYTMGDNQNRIYQVWRYNTITKEKQMIYENLDELVSVGISQSNDKKYFFISADSYETSDTYYFTHNDVSPIQFTPKIEKHKYSVDYHEGNFLIRTNKDNSDNFKIMICSKENTYIDNWLEFIEYNESIYIKNLIELKNYLIICYKENGHNLVRIIPFKNSSYLFNNSFEITVSDMIRNISVYSCPQYDSNIIYYTQNSLKTPYTIFKINLDNQSSEFVRQKPVPNYDPSKYITERKYAPSHDGTMVPISIIYHRDKFKGDGTNKLYLYGYGSYGHTVNPTFMSTIIPLLNRGFVYAIAHVRGGSFLGYKWYEDGKMEKKINTFHDFNACAEYLINEKFTYYKGITIEGRSAGGLLVGAAMTMRPDLYNTVIAGVPFVDVMNTMCDPTIPLTIPEWEQWGNPNQKKYYDLMLKYSPYDNIKEDVKYPNILALAGLNDPRVQYWEPAKFVAKLRHHQNKDNKNIILLKTEMEQGHFGGMDRYKHLKETALTYSFVLKSYSNVILI
tara:strand:+ start:1601 stop:3742 length:2142 start_codon:yes stop_codon:yes gene_type:complete